MNSGQQAGKWVRWSVGWRDPGSNRTRSSASLESSRTSSNASSQCCQTRSYRPRHAGRERRRAGATPSAAGAHPCCPGRVGAACCGRGLRAKSEPNRSGERLRERNLSEIPSTLNYGLSPGWDNASARSRGNVCLAPTREELIQHGPARAYRQRVRVAAYRLWSSQVAAVCRAPWSPIG